MNIYLTISLNQLKQFVAGFPRDNLPVALVKDAAFLISGWKAIARIVEHISKSIPFVKEIKTPISMLGAFSIILISHASSIAAAGTVAILAAIAFASTEVKTSYSPEEFKALLLQEYRFLPKITVTGNLDLSGCRRLTSLPERLTVKGDLSLFDCRGLLSLPEGLTITGDLDLSYCTSLPERLAVKGGLFLSACVRLLSLPEGLMVGGLLKLSGCIGLASLPEGLTIKGDLDLSGCTQLTSLPNWITTLGKRADGNIRQIYLGGIGLSEALLNKTS